MNELSVPSQKRESGDDRRLAIAQAARALLVEKGFEGLRTRDIAKCVGINVATLHYHVPSKEALIKLVAESMAEEFRAQALRYPREKLTALELLRRQLADFRDKLVNTPQLILIFAELLVRAKRDENVAAHIDPMHETWVGKFTLILSQGRADGSFRADMDAASAAQMITGALKSAWCSPDRLDAFDRLAAEIERAIIAPHPPTRHRSKE